MAFELANFKEVGGPGNSIDGGQLYSVFSRTDSVATMMADGYLNNISDTLNPRDFIFLSGLDGSTLVQVLSNDNNNIILRNVGGVQTAKGSGAIDTLSPVTLLDTTGGGTYTLANGQAGFIKIITLEIKSGNAVITPTFFQAGTNMTFDAVGDSIILVYTNAVGWIVISTNGVVSA